MVDKKQRRVFYRAWLSIVFLLGVFILVSLACGGSIEEETPAPDEPLAPDAPTEAILPNTPSSNVETATPLPAAPTPIPGVPEERLLVLEWPGKIRVKDARIIRLTLVLDEEGNITPTALVADDEVSIEPVQIPNLYDTHNVIAEARLDMAGMDYRPSGDVGEPLRPGIPVTFLWSVRPPELGDYQGTIWLYLRFIPLDGGPESKRVLSAQVIEIQAVNLLGMGGTPARVLGSVGVVIGAVMGLDGVVSWSWGLFKKRRGTQAVKTSKTNREDEEHGNNET